MLTTTIKVHWLQKSDAAPAEYEDAYRIAETTETAEPAPGDRPSLLRVAVADGATGATFAGEWANVLCEDYVAGNLSASSLLARVSVLAARWEAAVRRRPLPWHAEAKLGRDGSHAALLGMTFEPATGAYHLLSVGDCLFLHLRPAGTDGDFAFIRAFPVERADDFAASPVLIPTQSGATSNLPAHVVVLTSEACAGDTLLLLTDALGAWFLREREQGRKPARWLAAFDLRDGDRQFAKMVRDARDSNRLKNDDVTLVSVRVTEGTPR